MRLLSFLFFGALACAQPWSGIIDATRAVDWSGVGVVGGVPTNRTTICSTLSPGATAANINSAIAACGANQVVKLNAGTYNLTTGITFAGKSNVTLRGSGPNSTFLVFADSDSCFGQGGDICMNGTDLSYYIDPPANVANWTAGFTQGATSITLSTVSGLQIGMWLVLDQLNDTSDTGNAFVCSIFMTCATEGPGGGGRTNREQEQWVKVTNIVGSVVTFTPGLHMPNWRIGQTPQAFWGTNTAYAAGQAVEDLSMDHANSTNGKAGIYMIFTANSWVKNVRSLSSNRNHVWLFESPHNTVRDSYFYGTQNGASQSYGIEEFMTSDNLIENNILQRIATPLQTNEGTGSVFGYNFTVNDYYNVSPTWQQASSYLHAAGTDMILHEGNSGTSFTGDVVHGTHNFVTGFRNYWIGWETGKDTQTVPIILYTFNRYMNWVGNVLGKSGYHDTYQSFVPTLTNQNTAIYRFGSGDTVVPDDTLTKTSSLRWGNYDTVTAANRWCGNSSDTGWMTTCASTSEIPTGLPIYSSAVPASETLPSSFYLAGRPSWWSAGKPWPPIGPDVTGGNITGIGGHAYTIPAQDCYLNVMGGPPDGSGSALAFAGTCYLATVSGSALSGKVTLSGKANIQ